ncbi:interferon-induced protein 44-like [Astyanax mexicanus]|uniref:interferon-induced protein 44-like n=1 Tax=Astyanax mexicanus TaxID=7994 RepID=UPI0020CADE9B|nr:interferon-induced protein 44-like [Astyanax mexicanus]
MSAVTSRLSKQQEMKLCSMLSCSRLSLLFKGSVHGYTGAAFHQKCDNQGPTVTVAHNISGYIFGAYTSKNYAQTGQNIADANAFLFSFNEREMKKDPLRAFRTYHIKGGRGSTPVTLCDTMGLEEGASAGLDIDDFTSILRGHIQGKYQSNPSMPLQTESPSFCKEPGLKDKIHTVVYVLDSSKVKLLSDKMIEKLAAIRRKANQMGVPQLVLLTKVDEACPSVAADLKTVYQSHSIYKTMQKVSSNLGVTLSAVIPVKNYSQDLELDIQTDILLLNVLIQMLRATEGFFDDLYHEQE